MDWYQDLLQAPATPAAPRADRPNVTASEVASYMFCGRSWWLRSRSGPSPEAVPLLEDGQRRHAAAAGIADPAKQATHVLRWAVIGAIALAACALVVYIGAR
jgi:hypothetical protein